MPNSTRVRRETDARIWLHNNTMSLGHRRVSTLEFMRWGGIVLRFYDPSTQRFGTYDIPLSTSSQTIDVGPVVRLPSSKDL